MQGIVSRARDPKPMPISMSSLPLWLLRPNNCCGQRRRRRRRRQQQRYRCSCCCCRQQQTLATAILWAILSQTLPRPCPRAVPPVRAVPLLSGHLSARLPPGRKPARRLEPSRALRSSQDCSPAGVLANPPNPLTHSAPDAPYAPELNDDASTICLFPPLEHPCVKVLVQRKLTSPSDPRSPDRAETDKSSCWHAQIARFVRDRREI